jgi:hypothetical protein
MIRLRRIVFSLVSISLVAAATHFSFFIPEPSYAMTGIWLTFSLFVFALGWPEVAESITFLGNSVKTREVKEATNELKAIAKSLALVMLESTQAAGRWGGGISWERKQQLREEIEASLIKSGFDPQEINQIFYGWNRWACFDYASVISTYAQKKNATSDTKWTNEHSKKFQKINKPDIPAKAGQVRHFMTENGFLDTELEKYISMMEFYETNGRHENSSEWTKLIEEAR